MFDYLKNRLYKTNLTNSQSKIGEEISILKLKKRDLSLALHHTLLIAIRRWGGRGTIFRDIEQRFLACRFIFAFSQRIAQSG